MGDGANARIMVSFERNILRNHELNVEYLGRVVNIDL
jgi:hypothetical protein